MSMLNVMKKQQRYGFDPVRLQESGGFNRKELSRILEIIVQYRLDIQEAWNDYFGC